jgi:hypothetical protein
MHVADREGPARGLDLRQRLPVGVGRDDEALARGGRRRDRRRDGASELRARARRYFSTPFSRKYFSAPGCNGIEIDWSAVLSAISLPFGCTIPSVSVFS